jgi:hypothetical protein
MVVLELALILGYVCFLLIKTCNTSSEVCATYGFGETASGVYLFFIAFALGMLVLLLVGGLVRVYFEGNLPKLFLIAQAHSVPVSKIFFRVAARRCRYA